MAKLNSPAVAKAAHQVGQLGAEHSLGGLETAAVPSLVVGPRFVISWANHSAQQLLSSSDEAVVGEDLLDHIVSEDRARAAALLQEGSPTTVPVTVRLRDGGGGRNGVNTQVNTQDGSVGWGGQKGRRADTAVDFWVASSEDELGNRVCHLIEVTHHTHALAQALCELDAHRSAASLASAQSQTLELIALGEGLEAALNAVCRMVESQQEQLSSAVLVLEADKQSLRVGAAPSLPEEFWHFLAGRTPPEAGDPDLTLSGPCPSTTRSCAATWSEDLVEEARWPGWREMALASGLRSLFCSPIIGANGTVLGSLAFFWGEPHRITPVERRLFEGGSALAAVAIQRSMVEAAMAEAATHDPLTGLPNRSLFLDRLRLSLARGRRRGSQVAVLFLDLDRFKLVNDSLGHAAGDRLLVAAANRLVRAVRPGDTVARFGGDEFTVLCEEVDDADAAHRLGERLAGELRRPFVIAHRRFYVTASIGIALGESDSRPQELLRDADVAMYRSKEKGRNRIEMFDRSLRVRTLARLEDESTLRTTLEDGELPLHYQPIIDLRSGRPIGVETLLRWRRNGEVDVAPQEIVALAEEAGLIHYLGARTLQQAGRQVSAWRSAGLIRPDFFLAMNLSAAQLTDRSLVETVTTVLSDNSMGPAQLCLELSESSLIDDQPETTEVLDELHRLGVTLAIDDFGTGWSSIARLRALPIKVLKIDKSLVGSVPSSREVALLDSVVGLARALDLAVIVEGIETPEQLRVVRSLDCWAAQGYHLARPAGADATAGLIQRGVGRYDANGESAASR